MKNKKKEKKVKQLSLDKINVVNLEFTRSKGIQKLYIEVVPKIEELFRTDDVKISRNYKNSKGEGLRYYSNKEEITKFIARFNEIESRNRATVEYYGMNFYKNEYVNFSILRTVGISEGVEVIIDGLVLQQEFKIWLADFAQYIKFLYMNFVQKTATKATISLEI